MPNMITKHPVLRRYLRLRRILAAALLAAAMPALLAAEPAEPFTVGAGFVARIPTSDGKVIYERICQGCHMADGQGAKGVGAYPALAANPKLAAKAYPALLIVKGQAAMPSFGMFMSDEQVAAVVNYIRGNFGNAAKDAITAAEVATIRGAAMGAGRNLEGR